MINVDRINVDHINERRQDVGVTIYVRSQEAARRLGVSRATLYAYVSRGLIDRTIAIDGRTSLYSVEDLDRLGARSRRREATARPSIDVQITSAITRLDEDGLWYRGHDARRLAEHSSFEQVAELLWTGELPARPPAWGSPSTDDLAACRAAAEVLGAAASPLQHLLMITVTLGARHPTDDAVCAARRLLSTIPLADGRRRRGTYAVRLARRWHRRPGPQLCAALDRALVLLADHELATSTLAARLAASVRCDAYASLAAAMATVSGSHHGAAGAGAHRLLDAAARVGPRDAIAQQLSAGDRLPGFGHSVYRTGDPRLGPLLDAVRALPDSDGRLQIVDGVLLEAGTRLVHRPNIDFGLAALLFVAGLRADTPVFAVARIAGWAAHITEELSERPVRYRGLVRT